MYKNVILPASLLAGTIIGAGVFALPFVFEKAGILAGLFYLVLFGIILSFIHLMYADVIVKTEKAHRFVGYVKIYLGKFAGKLSLLTSVIGLLVSMVVYLVLAISFINLIAPSLPDAYKVLIFWLIASLTIFLRAKRLAFLEFLVTAAIIIIILVIFFFGIGNFSSKIGSLALFSPVFLFLPYGAVLFSLAGRTAVPSVVSYFRDKKDNLIKSKLPIILGTLAPAIVYLLFVFGIIGLSGQVSQDSVSGLIGNVPAWILYLLGILGFFSLWSTYIMLSQEIEKSLEEDFSFSKILAGVIAVFVPLVLYFAGFNNFLILISIVGGVFVGFEGILIILMWLKVSRRSPPVMFKKMNPVLPYLLLLIFFVGIVYALMY